MKTWLLVVALALFGGAASAEEGPEKDEKQPNVADHILEHVGDSTAFELASPFGGEIEVPIAHWFEFLRFERTPGACSQPTPATMTAFPSLAEVQAGCIDLRPTKAVLMMWLACGLMALVLFLGRKRDQYGVPKSRFGHIVEALVLFVRDDIVVPNIGKAEAARYTPYLTSLFFFVLFTNWLGLIPGFFAGTGVVMVTTALALLTFFLTQVAAIRSAGLGGYLKHLTGGTPALLWPIMIPVEILGLFTKPLALLVRLFANMLGGHMVIFFLLSLIFILHVGASIVSVPMAAAIYLLEIFVGILQAYLFTLLTTLFIGQGVAMGHHEHHDEAHGEAHH